MLGWSILLLGAAAAWLWLLFENTEAALRIFVILGRVLWKIVEGCAAILSWLWRVTFGRR